jgi:hypothetical protein
MATMPGVTRTTTEATNTGKSWPLQNQACGGSPWQRSRLVIRKCGLLRAFEPGDLKHDFSTSLSLWLPTDIIFDRCFLEHEECTEIKTIDPAPSLDHPNVLSKPSLASRYERGAVGLRGASLTWKLMCKSPPTSCLCL